MTPFDTPQPWIAVGLVGLGGLHLWACKGGLNAVQGSRTVQRLIRIDMILFLALIAASIPAWLVAIPGSLGAILQVAPFVYSVFAFAALVPLLQGRRSQPSP